MGIHKIDNNENWLQKHFRKILRKVKFWTLAKSEVARFDDIILSDADDCEQFKILILAALKLVKDVDSRRFERIKKHIKWIVHCTRDQPGAAYFYDGQICAMDYEFSRFKIDSERNVAYFARTLVHEATHGTVEERNISYTKEFCSRIESLCVKEENRFVKCLALKQPDLAEKMFKDYDPSEWKNSWQRTRIESHGQLIRRLFLKIIGKN